ncbi:hypothetical protein RWV98_05750 [Agathobaculum sp. NTUH-O15-33]|uniref:rolling circle replication-associated protein n=1 Tax=Agathobaculum sp. NTUH-O15-33 TaxID=3079302 RepID=UPI00295849C4|nr:hypothetical protein [Agathobaculum sp. NTUH-O15-33]WNX85771.1 hypothetical protein RWV98_05750 [Agathobaculum sp. NTUH-O15-33]
MKRRKTVRAGRLVWDIVYPVPNPRDDEYVRKKKKQISARAMELTNCNSAQRKLELRMAAAFDLSDLVVTLTFGDWALPSDCKAGRKLLSKFLRQLREYRNARGQELFYIICPEGLHGDHRLHFHLILNQTENDLEVIRSLWPHGDQIDLRHIYDKTGYGESGYSGWAGYLSKERREASLNGKRMFTCSRNLPKPKVTYDWVDDGSTVEAPPGATNVVESGDRNEFASFKAVKYLLPKAAVKSSVSFISGSKLPLTKGRGRRKVERRVDKPKQKRYNKRQGEAV